MTKKSMGTDITAREAADILGVSVQSVYNLQRRGMLKATGQLRQELRFSSEAVCALAEARSAGKQHTLEEMHSVVSQLRATCTALERRVRGLEELLGASPLHLEDSQEAITSLVYRIEGALQSGITLDSFHEWCTILYSVHAEALDLVELYLGYDEPWKPFLCLAAELYKACPPIGHPPDQEALSMLTRIDIVRRSLRQAAWLYCTNRRGKAFSSREFPETATDDPFQHLLRDHVYNKCTCPA